MQPPSVFSKIDLKAKVRYVNQKDSFFFFLSQSDGGGCLLSDKYIPLHKAQTLWLQSEHSASQSFYKADLKRLPFWFWAIH